MIVEGAKACKKHGSTLKIKKAQFLPPEQMGNVINKAKNFLDVDNIILTERGTCFGYNNLIVDTASFQIMKSFGVRTVHDATHCVQRPGGLGTTSGGKERSDRNISKSCSCGRCRRYFYGMPPKIQIKL